ncbi:bifunctional adenosylcobinamide kinase/adenosylcobinamide-phosphate guanylyltransferase [Acetivibrio mesophilus]|uniref:Adenosylcobinamide kinase n=1 Tax=Acetivibrio mesophilus TaxID=2487273 RepID=A0A4Q0I3V7_9FIRM|nr:bifunctional adenosylcobinamide kinase/adenosylcobinamide-phosphate guanylyltransferase [Acetivibrio mesophilus]ODM27950.1 bifunctional adenosylcobinamide kinase/adenosylcobinamide-phosphate guanylyltransferase [Clostridium sp. Bc-iso-3]RXE58385.1 bifunctional adenosylcobinamide kinase/adenosylcobinamide-phosphate guanylyltransferase [Acetivibrio mesophilus]HHV28850.1 bifunctional adenosylcobinamide kinase/adenosylcobinamide-phosphate guanylyltransferase [Clostridium sp.]
MGKFILVTGGARSGKSSFAESLIRNDYDENDVLYIATSIPFDEEMKIRVKKHREQRPAGWETLEAYRGLDIRLKEVGAGKKYILLDCITLMVSNIILEKCVDWNILPENAENEAEQEVICEVQKLLSAVRALDVTFIAVTNEVGMGIVPENKLSRVFQDIAGRVNQMLARNADDVYLCVSGIPIKIK